MHRQAALAGVMPDFFENRERSYGATGEIGGVLDLDEAGCRAKGAALGIDDRLDVRPGERAAGRNDWADQAAREAGCGGHLPVQNVRARLADDLLPWPRVQANGDLVAHGSRGHEEAGFAVKNLGGAALQQVDCGVFAVDVVANLGCGHGGAHLRRGTGYGVAAQVYHGAGAHGAGCFGDDLIR